MIRTQLYLPKQLHSELKLQALRKRESVAAIVRRILEEGIENAKQQEPPGAVLFKIAGRGKGKVPKDLSKNLTKYLYGEKSTYAHKKR